VFTEINPDPIIADEQQIKLNPRSRSAKLRWARVGQGA
jgi:16S rRNA C1402 N4-methylase RsmH